MKKKLLLPMLYMIIQHYSFCQTYTSSLLSGTPPETKVINPQKISSMLGLAANSAGEIFVCDGNANLIRKIQKDNKIVTFAGNGVAGYKDDIDTAARFSYPKGIVIDTKGNLFVIESSSSRIRKITPSATVSTFFDGNGELEGSEEETEFNTISGIAIDSKDNLYITDGSNKMVKKITSSGDVTTLVENLLDPSAIAYDKVKNILYFVDSGKIMRLGPADESPITIAESPDQIEMLFCNANSNPIFSTSKGLFILEQNASGKLIPKQISLIKFTSCTNAPSVGTILGVGPDLYGLDTYSNSLRLRDLYAPVTIIYPNEEFKDIQGMIVDEEGNLYMADRGTHRILKRDKFGTITTFAGSFQRGLVDGNGTNARFDGPTRLAWDNYGNILVTDNHTLRKITPEGDVTTFRDRNNNPLDAWVCYGIAVDQNDNIYLAEYGGGQKIKIITPNNEISTYIDNKFMQSFGYYDFGMPYALQIDKAGNLIIAIQMDGILFIVSPDKKKVRRIGVSGGASIDGFTSYADFRGAQDIILDKDGNLFVLDVNTIRKVSRDSLVTTIAGSAYNNSGLSSGYKEGTGRDIKMNMPWCMAMTKEGDFYVSDNGNNLLRIIRKNVVTAIDESEREYTGMPDFNVYPNPARDKVTIQLLSEGSLGVYNNVGMLMYAKTVANKEETIDFTNYSKGMYYVVFQTDGKMYKRTIVVE